MHLLRAELRSLDETAPAVDLEQTRADFVVLSFTDSDLAALAKAAERLKLGASALRLASLADLRHPYSVDLYVEKVIAHARFVLIRLLGGLDYWRYGVEEIARAARSSGCQLAIVPGDARADPRLDAASTLPVEDLRRLWTYLQNGGADNADRTLRFMRGDADVADPSPQSPLGVFRKAAGAERALIVFYRSAWLAGDTEPYEALAEALEAQGFAVEALYVTSLKDPAAVAPLRARLERDPPAVILNATAFSARLDEGGAVFDACDAPVLQVGISLATAEQWAASARGLSPADLAMNVALPEVDGRVFAGAISFKAPAARIAALEYAPQRSRPHGEGVAHVARLAAAWGALRRTANADKRLAFVLSDYPAKGGRQGYAVGLDTYASVAEIAARLSGEGYRLDAPHADLAKRLAPAPALSLRAYRERLAALPGDFVRSVEARWGDPAEDARDGFFHFAYLRLGASLVALQPDRGHAATRAGDYHDGALAPRHAYVAFYLWLREVERVDALVHVGAHGTLEWLPGKAVALSETCAPRAVLGALPVIYPFIVNNPGEAAQAKRRTSAVTLGHLTPPLVQGPAHGATAEIEGLMDEFAEARALDPRRARRLAELVLERARDSGLAEEAGLSDDPAEALVQLDAFLCDIKEMRIGDGLHTYGRGEGEMDGLVAALGGRRVAPGPGGAPSRGRLDVLPTGRNLYSLDPRTIPTRTAWELGQRAGEAFLAAYVSDHGEWPRNVVFDLWGSSAMRTGGEDLAQALWLIGARPLWDVTSNRVSGYEVLAPAVLGRPRVDVTLRISGLFRDVFPEQVTLFHAAAEAVAAREDETAEDNPLRGGASARVFGAAPGAYGTGVARAALSGDWERRDDLGEAYLAATGFAYSGGEAQATGAFREKVAEAQAFVHVQDMAGQDVLDSDAYPEHEGGFAAAAAALGSKPALYHLDATDPQAPKARTLTQEIARVVRARATSPVWLKGQMRHGYRGAAEIAETVDNLYLYAATTDAVSDRQFDLLFDAVCADPEVRGFLLDANPQAASAIADRLVDAIARGFWKTRRNSVEPLLQSLRGAP
jgi:cobaltochelatase CobN